MNSHCMPDKRPRTDEERVQAEAERVRTYNGRCCGGQRLAGAGGTYKLESESEEKRALAKKARASWDDAQKGLVVTKCGKCKKMLCPTTSQLKLMSLGVHIVDTPALLTVADKDGVAIEALMEQLKAGAQAMECSVAEYARVHLDVLES